MLVEMDGFDQNVGIVVIAATNGVDILGHALLRPGRFDRRISATDRYTRTANNPRSAYAQRAACERSGSSQHARGTPGFSGAELADLVNEAVLFAARNQREEITMADFDRARDKVLTGTGRPSAVMTEQDRMRIAVHEAGHALVAMNIDGADPIHKVSIIPHGMALGITMQLPENDRILYSKEYLEGQIALLMGGRVAEEAILGSFGSGSSNDIERATSIARKMVRQLGMSKLGPVVCMEPGFAGPHRGFLSEYSSATEQRIDEEVENILLTQMKRAKTILERQKSALEKLRDILLEEETIDQGRFLAIVEGVKLTR